MKIAFIAGCLEPGRDGVGDYTRRLAAECIRRSCPSVIVGLHDGCVSESVNEMQESDGMLVPVLRLPRIKGWGARITEARRWLLEFLPDWASVQFVPFSFQRKGLCFGLGNRLASMVSRKPCHIMLHELWIGLGENSSPTHRAWGLLQRGIIKNMISRLKPSVVHTHAEPYRRILGKERIPASILPLFSNIPYVAGDGWTGLLEPLVSHAVGTHAKRSDLYLAGVFGAVHPEWSETRTVDLLAPFLIQSRKRLVMVFHGKNQLSEQRLIGMTRSLQNRAISIQVGERPNADISRILQTLDLGLATTPYQMIQKSGSVAAMLEHGLPVLVTRDDWRARGAAVFSLESFSRVLTAEQFSKIGTLPGRRFDPEFTQGVRRVAGDMLSALQASAKTHRM